MINTKAPLEEKMALFWHHLFATGFAKLNHPAAMLQQIAMFRKHGLADFRTLLVELSKDPAMIFWLDNQENTNDVHNENYGRELLELFSMGIGNYTEDDVKNCARAFTGWTMKHPIPGAQPFGRFDWEFEFRPDLHDYAEKTFLGETGNFDGADIVDIIVRQQATAQFVARRLLSTTSSRTCRTRRRSTSWPRSTSSRSTTSGRSCGRCSCPTPSARRSAYYAQGQEPGRARRRHRSAGRRLPLPALGYPRGITLETRYMGQDLLNPPSVEGWHTGKEWIDTGILVERVNFAACRLATSTSRASKSSSIGSGRMGELSPSAFVDGCLDLVGPLDVAERNATRWSSFAEKGGALKLADGDRAAEQRVGEMLQLIVATREYQLV